LANHPKISHRSNRLILINLAVNALDREDSADAEHHLRHAIEISSGDEQAKLQSLLADLQAGKMHDVEHEMEAMTAGMHN
jgi:Tfp pilus assembly protein PilF